MWSDSFNVRFQPVIARQPERPLLSATVISYSKCLPAGEWQLPAAGGRTPSQLICSVSSLFSLPDITRTYILPSLNTAGEN